MGIIYVVKEIKEGAGGFEQITNCWTFTKVKDALKLQSEMEHKSQHKVYTRYETHVETL